MKAIKVAFENELNTEGDVRRILKKGTLYDLIKLSFFCYQKDKKEKHLIDIFNYSMKIKLLSAIKAIDINGSCLKFL